MRKTSLLAAFSILLASSAYGQGATTKDVQAYNFVFDRLGKLFPDIPAERVHLLSVIIPATWAADDDNEAEWELQSLAGAIPSDEFSLDPSRMKLRLDQVYAQYINDMLIEEQDPTKLAGLQKGKADFAAAQEEYEKVKIRWDGLWSAREKSIKDSGRPVRTSDRTAFSAQHGGMFAKVDGLFDAAIKLIVRNSDVNQRFLDDARLMQSVRLGVFANGDGIFPYRGGQARLRSIMTDCDDASAKGWDSLVFDQTTNSQSLRSSSWNASGGWNGGFFGMSVGGGNSSYDNLIKNSGDRISLDFCQLTYIPLDPGPWFDPTLLQAIDNGSLKLKPGSMYEGKPVLGKNGVIPQFVKGAIVARRIKFFANSSESQLHDIRSVSGGGGGFRIGGWGFGGSASSVKFDHEYTSQAGSYGRSSMSSVPVIIAIVTEPSKGSGDTKPPSPTSSPVTPSIGK